MRSFASVGVTSVALVLSSSLAAQIDQGQGAVTAIGGLALVDAQSQAEAATGGTFTGMLGVCVDNLGHYFVTSRRDTAMATNPHMLFEYDANGAFLTAYMQPAGTASSAWGIRDMAYDPDNDIIYGAIPGGPLYAFDNATKMFDGTKDITVTGGAEAALRALAYAPGAGGTPGTFYCANFGSDIFSFDTTGATLGSFPAVTTGSYGLGYHADGDHGRGSIWIHSQRGGTTHARAGSTLNGIEVATTTGLETGQQINGDYIGGTALAGGAEIHVKGGRATMVCFAQGGLDGFYEQRVDLNYGTGCVGELGYTGGAPYAGNASFTVTADNLTGASSFLLFGVGEASMPMPGLTSCDLLLPVPFITALGPAATAAGSAQWPLPIPATVFPGDIFLQAVDVTGALPFGLTDGARAYLHL